MNSSSVDSVEFSIIVPTYGRPGQLAACLLSLQALAYPRDRFEVIVVDDGSPQPLTVDQGAFEVTVIRQERGGPAQARNTGAARARGKYLVFTDDDCAPAADWLQRLRARFADASESMIGGRTINALPGNPYATASQMLVSYLYEYYNADPGQACFLTSNNLALPRDRFHEIGRFDTTLTRAAGEDRELCDRWLHYGHGMTYAPEALVYHAHPLTLCSFWRQHFHYGQAACYFHRRRAQRRSTPIKPEPVSFYLDLLRYPFTQDRGLRAVWVAALLFLSQAANAAGFFEQHLRPVSVRSERVAGSP